LPRRLPPSDYHHLHPSIQRAKHKEPYLRILRRVAFNEDTSFLEGYFFKLRVVGGPRHCTANKLLGLVSQDFAPLRCIGDQPALGRSIQRARETNSSEEKGRSKGRLVCSVLHGSTLFSSPMSPHPVFRAGHTIYPLAVARLSSIQDDRLELC